MSKRGVPRGTCTSTKEFNKKLKSIHGDRYKLIGVYEKSSIKTSFLCKRCDSTFESTPNNILRNYKNGCTHCSRVVAGEKKASAAARLYPDKLESLLPGKFKVVGIYKGAKEHVDHECLDCGHTVSAIPNAVLSRGTLQCPTCLLRNDPRSIQARIQKGMTFGEALRAAYPELRFLRTGRTISDSAEFVCRSCGTKQERKVQYIRTSLCSACGYSEKAEKLCLTHAEYLKRVSEKHIKIQVLGTYRTMEKRIGHRCLDCFHTWKAKPANILQSTIACPSCVHAVRKTNLRQSAKMQEMQFGERRVRVQGYEPLALTYMLNNGYDPSDIIVESEGGVPIIEYKIRRRNRRYYPDMYVKSDNAIIEVKSTYTLGLGSSRRERKNWNMTCAKALACREAGFKFALFLMRSDGVRLRLPKNWPLMKKEDVARFVRGQK